MTNTIELKVAAIRKGLSMHQIAKAMGISQITLSTKVNNKREFTVQEVKKICEILDLSLEEKERIFFG